MNIRLIILTIAILHSGTTEAAQDWLQQLIASKENVPVAYSKTNTMSDTFFSNHALVFFYSSACPYCHQFAPTLKDWSWQHQASVMALSFDNAPLLEFPEFKPVSTEWLNAAFAGRTISYPALFIVNTRTHLLYPVNFGTIDSIELSERMRNLIPKIKGYEQKGAGA